MAFRGTRDGGGLFNFIKTTASGRNTPENALSPPSQAVAASPPMEQHLKQRQAREELFKRPEPIVITVQNNARLQAPTSVTSATPISPSAPFKSRPLPPTPLTTQFVGRENVVPEQEHEVLLTPLGDPKQSTEAIQRSAIASANRLSMLTTRAQTAQQSLMELQHTSKELTLQYNQLEQQLHKQELARQALWQETQAVEARAKLLSEKRLELALRVDEAIRSKRALQDVLKTPTTARSLGESVGNAPWLELPTPDREQLLDVDEMDFDEENGYGFT